jgi:hypothetical protein
MKNIYEARDYVQHCTKSIKQQFPVGQYTEEQFVVPTFMMLLTTESHQKYLANNKHYQQALSEVFEKYMNFYITTAKKYNANVTVHANKKYEMMFAALRSFQALDTENDLYDDITVVNAIKTLVNMNMLHSRFIDIAIDYSQQDKVTMFRPISAMQ